MFSIFRSHFTSILSTLLFVFIFSGCESSTNTSSDEEFRLVQVPLGSGSKKHKDFSDDSSPYYCLVSTLNPEDKQFAYRYSAYYLHFPNRIANKAKKQGKEDEWVILKYGNKNAIQRYETDTFDNGGLVRMAKCLIPGTEKAKRMVAKRMKRFGTKSWVFEKTLNNDSSAIATDDDSLSPVQTDWEWECYRWFVTEVCVSDGENYDCQITDQRCISYHLVYYEDGPGGGGSGPGGGGGGGSSNPPGGSDGDPCTEDGEQNGIPFECYQNPNPCEEHPPSDPERPAYCDDPCSTGDSTIDNNGVQETFEYLYEKSEFDKPIEQRLEQGGFITRNSNGDYGFAEFPSDWPRFACGINPPSNFLDAVPDNTVAMVHTHPFFVGEDTRPVCGNDDGVENYTSGFGEEDLNILIQVANHLEDHTIKGYVLDGNNNVTYTTLSFTGPEDLNSRCGY